MTEQLSPKELDTLRRALDSRSTTGIDKEAFFQKLVVVYQQGFRCKYCHRKMLVESGNKLSFSIDHIVPKSKGGSNFISNLDIICLDCNRLKHDMDADVFKKTRSKLIAKRKAKIQEEKEKMKLKALKIYNPWNPKLKDMERESFREILSRVAAQREQDQARAHRKKGV